MMFMQLGAAEPSLSVPAATVSARAWCSWCRPWASASSACSDDCCRLQIPSSCCSVSGSSCGIRTCMAKKKRKRLKYGAPPQTQTGWGARTDDLEQLRRAEASHPEEAALGGGGPGAGEEVEDVGARERRLELEQLVVVLHALLHDEAQVGVQQQVRLQPASELRQPLAVVVQPPRVLHVEHGGACMRGYV
ncbi:Dual specificity protein phosphatase Diacylglycerol kinase catalytic region [Zea mays]|uniref:Dual specificity protein phosphatase Diacylglycerol kinase catalytic region n=1 Tax=Zea mays TaxID=4577 RepID=A0A1D6G822_MAIZE|nr:Dual specificity protein phosphatase Diacylglycerol kinase catalytic region [Zea mays]